MVDFLSNLGRHDEGENYRFSMKSAVVTSALERFIIASRARDPRADALLQGARDLGVAGLRDVEIHDVVFLAASLDDEARGVLHDLLADPLLQVGRWVSDESHDNHTSTAAARVVETALLPGVTDPVAAEIERVATRAGVAMHGVATGRRFVLHGRLSPDEVGRLATRLLANPIIERWSIDASIAPSFVPREAEAMASPELLGFDAEATPAHLEAINRERGLALDAAELSAVREYFVARGRRPTDVEVETIAQTWSEHCSHKTFRAKITIDGVERPQTLLAQLRESTERLARPFVVSAFDGNAGIISFDGTRTYAVKCETHNHPSAVEPFGGANTGVGGVIRDVLGADHHPIAVTDVLCFGEPNTDVGDVPDGSLHPRRIRDGVVAGVADYGNKIGLPTVAGAVFYDRGYVANPLVFAGCIGVSSDWRTPQAPQPGDRCIVLGGRTGRDGIRGATFSSMTMDATTGDVAGASVQIGDPIIEKLLIDALGEARGLYRSITDCGAGGLSSAIGEMADGVGANIELTEVPLKYPGLSAWEVWLSEAQERMVVAVAPAHTKELLQVCARHGVEAVDVGAFTGDGVLRVAAHGVTVLEIDTDFLHHGRPQRQLTATAQRVNRAATEPTPPAVAAQSVGKLLLSLLAHVNIASKESIIRRYDHEIRGATLRRPLVGVAHDAPGDGIVLVEPREDCGLAVGIGMSPFTGEVDAERMAWLAVDEAIRNVVAVGADPRRVALLDNFSWGDPRRASTLGQLAAAVDGCVAAASAYQSPFVSGKDSLNNEWVDRDATRRSVPPTLVITAVAAVDDAQRTLTSAAREAGNVLMMLGHGVAQWCGSHATRVVGASGTVVPAPDHTAPHRYVAVHQLIADGVILACHDCAEGGLAVALAEMLVGGRLGARTESASELLSGPKSTRAVATTLDEHAWWFAEGPGRVLVEVRPEDVARVRAVIDEAVVVATLTSEPVLHLAGEVLSLESLVEAFTTVDYISTLGATT
jgi:phosphoribosylformylglycinamidine synthase